MSGIDVDSPPLGMMIVDPNTGFPTRPFIQFIHRLWERTGGGDDAIEAIRNANAYPLFQPIGPIDPSETNLVSLIAQRSSGGNSPDNAIGDFLAIAMQSRGNVETQAPDYEKRSLQSAISDILKKHDELNLKTQLGMQQAATAQSTAQIALESVVEEEDVERRVSIAILGIAQKQQSDIGRLFERNNETDTKAQIGMQQGITAQSTAQIALETAQGIEQTEQSALMPIGGIIMLAGGFSIPQGWALCDGNNGTPDLRGKFVAGANSDFPQGTTGGQIEYQDSVFSRVPVLSFDGVGDYVSVGPGVDPTTTFSVEAWIFPTSDDTSNARVVQYGDLQAEGTWALGYKGSNDTAFFRIESGSGDIGPLNAGSIPRDQWTHLAGVHDGSRIKLYQDGMLIGDKSSANFTVPSGKSIGIAATSGGGSNYTGNISDDRIWNTARTQTEIQDNQNTRLSGNQPGLVGYWRLDDAQGTVAKDSAGNNDGTLVNGPTWAGNGPVFDEVKKVITEEPTGISLDKTSTGVAGGTDKTVLQSASIQDPGHKHRDLKHSHFVKVKTVPPYYALAYIMRVS